MSLAFDFNSLAFFTLRVQILFSQLREESRQTGRSKLKHQDIMKKKREGYEHSFLTIGNRCPKVEKNGGKNQQYVIIGYNGQVVVVGVVIFKLLS